jgi:hypothetical protein
MPTERTDMKSITSRVPLILTGTVLLAAMILLATSRLEYCGQSEALQPQINAVVAAESHWPTLAPPQQVVFVRVETDKSDLEIGWAEN